MLLMVEFLNFGLIYWDCSLIYWDYYLIFLTGKGLGCGVIYWDCGLMLLIGEVFDYELLNSDNDLVYWYWSLIRNCKLIKNSETTRLM